MKTIIKPSLQEAIEACQRPVLEERDLSDLIDAVFATVKSQGDKALLSYTKKFDGVELISMIVQDQEIQAAKGNVTEALKAAINKAAKNIKAFHKTQELKPIKIETQPGVVCWQESRAIETVGIYIPGGSAPLFSTVLMLAIPAQIAGCKKIVLCTPPRKDGTVDPHILFAAELCGVSNIYKVGGAQAIAAMTLGTETVPAVQKIFGPGNQYVTAAKLKAMQTGIPIDMPAGPSELMVLADDSCVPAFVASDLLSQAEHGADSQVICQVPTKELANNIIAEINTQLAQLSRKDIATKSLENAVVIVNDNKEFKLELINEYAPEHLILATSEASQLIPGINACGSVFIGNYTPESAGDYASGTNHTLPTNGFAKSYSGVNLDAFVKKITFQEISASGIKDLGPSIELMAEAEQLDAHKNAVTLRLKAIENEN
mgnify:CR=1 FL=1